MIVYGDTPSPFARKVLVALEEKGMPYQLRRLIPVPKTPELLARNPLGKIPVLELDDGTCVPDSSVICLYLERVEARPALYPDDPVEYARALFLDEYADTRMAEVLGGVFFERWVKPNVIGREPDEERVQGLLKTEVPLVFDYLEAQIPAHRSTILDRFGIADIAVGAHLGSLLLAGGAIDARRWPKLATYAEALWERPSFARCMPA